VSQRSGYAQGQTQTLRTGGVTVVMGNSQNTPHYDSMGNVTSVTYVIPLTLTSYGDDHYIGKTAQLTTNATLSNAFAYAFLVAQFPSVPETTSVATSALSSFDAPQEALSYRLSDGVTTHFTLTVELITPTTQNAMYRVNLRQIRFFSNSVLSIGGTNMELLPRVAYESAAAFINN
jgi:hypothetical protein